MRGRQQPNDGEIDLDEVVKVGEGEELSQAVGVVGDFGPGMPGRELSDNPGCRRPHVVHMQLGLGQIRDEGGQRSRWQRHGGESAPLQSLWGG